MNNKTQNEGFFDRLKANWTGAKTAATNIGTGVASVAAGVPLKLTNVQDARIKQLFSQVQARIKPYANKLGNTNVATKLNAEIEVKKNLLGFINDFMKMTGEKKPNNVIATLQQPQYAEIANYIKKLGLSVPVSKKPVTPSASTTTPTPAPASSTPPTGGTPADGTFDVSKNYKFDASKNLWVNISTGVALNKSASDAKTVAYWNAVKKGTIIPENKTKIVYKEFFV
jgi:hypothetical protein